MIGRGASLQHVGWAALIGLCCALLFGLSLKVNALKSEVRLTERKIVSLKRETMYLETEYETRSNQQQLAAWNAVDFGYSAPGPGQFLESERQLAALGKPLGPGAPSPIRVAAAPEVPPPGLMPTMVSPLTGKPLGEEDREAEVGPVDHDRAAAQLAERLAKPDRAEPAGPESERKPAKAGADRAPQEKRP